MVLGRRLIALLVPTVLVAAAVLQPAVDAKLLFLDQTEVVLLTGELRTWSGLLSTVGVMAWAASAAICGFAAVLLRRGDVGGARASRFALFAALSTAFLGLDDAFQIHENLGPKLGLPQPVILLAYVAVAAVYVVLARGLFAEIDPVLVVIAAGGLGLSLAVDAVITSPALWKVALEDGAKLTGIWGAVVLHVHLMASLLPPASATTHELTPGPPGA